MHLLVATTGEGMKNINWRGLCIATTVWTVISAVFALLPFFGPYSFGKLFMQAHIGVKVPFVALLIQSVCVTLGQAVFLWWLIGGVYAFAQVCLFGLTCLIVYAHALYLLWSSRRRAA
jgi:hypothetical protein